MLKEIPCPCGFKIDGYDIFYRPIYKINPNVGNVLITTDNQLVIHLNTGNFNSLNEEVKSPIIRYADELEIREFHEDLVDNGFRYDSGLIYMPGRYYYFPEYYLYSGFQPQKKKWLNSNADRFYKKKGQAFDTYEDCANWCNTINEHLMRDVE